MPAERKPGMDNPYHDFVAMPGRPRLAWPDDARIAFHVVVHLEHFEWEPSPDAVTFIQDYGAAHHRPPPDIITYSYREYGNRVGVYGIMQALDRYGIRATAPVDAIVATRYPFLIDQCRRRGWEFLGHGLSSKHLITAAMSEEQEAAYIRESLSAVERGTGSRPRGWFGVEYSESNRTPDLLAREGLRYVCDWPNDEQPQRLSVSGGSLYVLPVPADLDDDKIIGQRHVQVAEWARMAEEAFDVLYEEAAGSGRVFALNLHPFLMGQPFRLKYLDRVLAHVCSRPNVWLATGSEIIDWYEQQQPQ
ncbi:MAG: polysaccharide deacetylase family protein [Chloroflexota bacterium]|nr:polysaccharide deacetylase family protein [Chloroflexota bacterium]MDE2885201.1 polysaccharide deacetylase family protein [Chloroflexota bacterium]